jgi:hypothetical protein
MIRVIFGSAVAALAMFVIGFIFFGPLGLLNLAVVTLDDNQAAAVRDSLSTTLPRTGTYFVPMAEKSAAQTVMYGQGPIATIHYNTGGFAAVDPATLVTGLTFNFVIALVMGIALLGISGRVADFGSRARLAVPLGVAGVAYTHLSEPIFYHHDWPHFIYVFVADGLMFVAAGLILAKLLPAAPVAAPAERPAEPEPAD